MAKKPLSFSENIERELPGINNDYSKQQITLAILALTSLISAVIYANTNTKEKPIQTASQLELHFDFPTETYFIKINKTNKKSDSAIHTIPNPYLTTPDQSIIPCNPSLSEGKFREPGAHVIHYNNFDVNGYLPYEYTTFNIDKNSVIVTIRPGEIECKSSIFSSPTPQKRLEILSNDKSI